METQELERQRIYNSAVRMLAGREHSCAELAQKLIRKYGRSDQTEQLIYDLIDQLSDQGLVDDQRFVEVLVRSRINRGYGPFYIQQELKSKGMPAHSAESVQEWQSADWLVGAADLVERKFTDCADDLKVWQKALRHLQRRGFPGHVVYEVLPDMPKS